MQGGLTEADYDGLTEKAEVVVQEFFSGWVCGAESQRRENRTEKELQKKALVFPKTCG